MTAGLQAEILAVGMSTPLGLDGPSAAAAVRAGLCRFRESPYHNKLEEPQVLSLVPDEQLPPLQGLRSAEPGSRAARMLQMGAYALAQACAPCRAPPPLLLALPEERAGVRDPVGPAFVENLARLAEVNVAERETRRYRQGGAGVFHALRDAVALLGAGAPQVVIGGVDSFLDRDLLDALDLEDRLLGAGPDGFVPGEGAAFLLLGSRGQRRRLELPPLAAVGGIALGVERGHRYSPEPCRGDGLSEAFQQLFASVPGAGPVRSVYAGLNGESLAAKEWSIAYLRSAERLAEDHALEHPADCLGDAGAALGPILLGLAALGLQGGHVAGPCLVWSASDREARGAALLVEAA